MSTVSVEKVSNGVSKSVHLMWPYPIQPDPWIRPVSSSATVVLCSRHTAESPAIQLTVTYYAFCASFMLFCVTHGNLSSHRCNRYFVEVFFTSYCLLSLLHVKFSIPNVTSLSLLCARMWPSTLLCTNLALVFFWPINVFKYCWFKFSHTQLLHRSVCSF